MFNRRKTPRFTGDLWKFPPEPLRGHGSGVHAPDGHNPTPWPIVAPRHNVGASAPCFRSGRASTHSVRQRLRRALLRGAHSGDRVFRCGIAGSYGRPVIPAGAPDATTDELP